MSRWIKHHGKICRNGGESGLTLLELIVTLVVSGIVMAIVGISMARSDQNAKRAAAAHAILSDLRYTQEMAMASRRQARFSLTSTGYAATWVDNGTYLRRAQLSRAETINVSFSSNDFAGLSIVPGPAGTVGFNMMGTPLISGSPLLSGGDLVVATIGGSLRVKIVPNTGYTYIE